MLSNTNKNNNLHSVVYAYGDHIYKTSSIYNDAVKYNFYGVLVDQWMPVDW
jgi:hypothetical protein